MRLGLGGDEDGLIGIGLVAKDVDNRQTPRVVTMDGDVIFKPENAVVAIRGKVCRVETLVASLEEALWAEETNIRLWEMGGGRTKCDGMTLRVVDLPIYKADTSNVDGRTANTMDGGIRKFAVRRFFEVVKVTRGRRSGAGVDD